MKSKGTHVPLKEKPSSNVTLGAGVGKMDAQDENTIEEQAKHPNEVVIDAP